MNSALLNNRKFQIGAAVAVLVVLLAGLMVFRNFSGSVTPVNNNVLPTQEPIPTITAENLGATLVYGTAKRTVILTVEKIDGIKAIDYELSYTAKGDIPRGAIGSLKMGTTATKEITLGTCSDVCHYDTDVKDVKAVLKITKDDGSVFSSNV